ncbi:MAG: ATP-dependent DNA helicase RecG [Bradymonadaceae bacterium]
MTRPIDEVTPGRFELVFDGDPSLDLTDLPKIGPKTARRLGEREIDDATDLLLFLPRSYRRTARYPDAESLARHDFGYVETIGEIVSRGPPNRHGRAPFEVVVRAASQQFKLLWFNLPYPGFSNSFDEGKWVRFEGEVDWEEGRPSLAHPQTDVTSRSRPDGRPESIELEPVYTSFEDVADHRVRRGIEAAGERLLPRTIDVLPDELLEGRDLGTVREALATAHVLGDWSDLEAFETALHRAHRRLVYEEFYTLQRSLARRYARQRRAAEAPVCENRELGRAIAGELPFELTDDQKRACARLAEELTRTAPMRRLLQGDVGSGKTIVALLTAAICIDSGHQVALMAPTDILARQHTDRARELFDGAPVDVELISGSIPDDERSNRLDRAAHGSADLVVGTHALFQQEVAFERLGLAIVDEQHKFGVEQRGALLHKGDDPHLLAMTATPIPRSLAHTAFGDLDLTIIRDKPPGRKPVATYLRDRRAAPDVYEYVAERVDGEDERAFFVYPMVESGEGARRSAVESAERLANGPLSELRVGVLHGQMPDETKHRTMSAFDRGDIDVLCATTVVEVGMDVAEASIMVVEDGEMFGLSQLHQLRGRVGRGGQRAICVVLTGWNPGEDARRRLESFRRTNDGFELAERDLEIRGPGEFLGKKQAGRAEFRFGDLTRDDELLEAARRDARRRALGDAGR